MYNGEGYTYRVTFLLESEQYAEAYVRSWPFKWGYCATVRCPNEKYEKKTKNIKKHQCFVCHYHHHIFCLLIISYIKELT